MVSPSVHISGSENVYSRAEGIVWVRIAIFNSGVGYWILSRHTDRISDIRYQISELDIIRQMTEKPSDGNAKLKQKTA